MLLNSKSAIKALIIRGNRAITSKGAPAKGVGMMSKTNNRDEMKNRHLLPSYKSSCEVMNIA